MPWQLQLSALCALLVFAVLLRKLKPRRTLVEAGSPLPEFPAESTVLDRRFVLEAHAGSGGMGQVFRALDRQSNQRVAVKVMRESRSAIARRFEREVAVLSSLHHPGIVRYVAHGSSESGRSYLAMEWLEGEDLASRLKRGPLGLRASLSLAAQVADALADAHAHDVVHRDLKPSNLWLLPARDADVKIKVLDFGIAHLADAPTMTNTGAVLGTPSYMAPEQASGAQNIDARTDVFALGCVLFECLTGAPPFRGENVMAVLAKVLFQDAPRLLDERPDAPPAVDALIARMLARKKEERPRDGGELRTVLASVQVNLGAEADAPLAGRKNARSLTSHERRMLSVILIAPADGARLDELARIARSRGGALEWLADGSAVVTFSTRVASDQAMQAARVALGVRALGLGSSIALATGRSELSGELPLGDAIDRAARMLRARFGRDVIAIDSVTAGLLDARFVLTQGERGSVLSEEHELAEGTRTLLGRPTECVGRDAELAMLQALLGTCVQDSLARAVIVSAPAGVGKSRLASELLRRVRSDHGEVSVWLGRGDPMRRGSALGLLGQALRSALVVHDPERMRQRLAAHFADEDLARVCAYLGELTGVSFADEYPILRDDAQLLSDGMLQALLDFVRAETALHPVLLVLEDLHWSDPATVRFVDAALRELADRPLMVLALARPELHELFPRLWAARRLQEVRLPELSRRAAETLVRSVLGDTLSEDTLEKLVARADGHAFYLEELIRAVASGDSAELPDTVLAMVQARLDALEPEARRVLRAASVFGERSWQGGMLSLLGAEMDDGTLAALLTSLIDQELLSPSGEGEYVFRHALLREGAYAMLTEADQQVGHRLAGEWLERRGESDASMLAEHFARGAQAERAATHYSRAAQQAIERGDPDTGAALAQRGLALEIPNPLALPLHAILIECHGWRGEWSMAEAHGEAMMRLVAPDQPAPIIAAIPKLFSALTSSLELATPKLETAIEIVRGNRASLESAAGYAFTAAPTIFVVGSFGRLDLALPCLARMRAEIEPLARQNLVAAAWLGTIEACCAGLFLDNPWAGLGKAQLAQVDFEAGAHVPGSFLARAIVGLNAWTLGALELADAILRSTLANDLGVVSSLRTSVLVSVWIDQGALELAEREARRMAASEQGPHAGRGQLALARISLRRKDLPGAERAITSAVPLLLTLPVDRVYALSIASEIALAGGHGERALQLARDAYAELSVLRTRGYCGPLVAWVQRALAEALHACTEFAEAKQSLLAARAHVLSIAEHIDDPGYRKRYLERVAANARIFELARGWLLG